MDGAAEALCRRSVHGRGGSARHALPTLLQVLLGREAAVVVQFEVRVVVRGGGGVLGAVGRGGQEGRRASARSQSQKRDRGRVEAGEGGSQSTTKQNKNKKKKLNQNVKKNIIKEKIEDENS